MESNWRWNVAEMGFAGAGYRFMARVLNASFENVFLIPYDLASKRYFVGEVYISVSGRLLVYNDGQSGTWDHWSFLELEPD